MPRQTSRVVALGSAIAVLALTTATQASAYDKERYGYAATHMLEFSDVPKSLGQLSDRLNFNVFPGSKSQRIYLCSGIPTSDPDEFKQVAVKVSGPSYNGSYTSDPSLAARNKNPIYTSLTVTVNEFTSSAAAAKTFDLITERAKKCKGTKTTTVPDDAGGPSSSYTSTFRNGLLPSVQSDGKPSVYVETDYLNQSPQESPAGSSGTDSIIVISQVGDALIQTYYSNSQVTRLSSKQKDGVALAANSAIQAWRD